MPSKMALSPLKPMQPFCSIFVERQRCRTTSPSAAADSSRSSSSSSNIPSTRPPTGRTQHRATDWQNCRPRRLLGAPQLSRSRCLCFSSRSSQTRVPHPRRVLCVQGGNRKCHPGLAFTFLSVILAGNLLLLLPPGRPRLQPRRQPSENTLPRGLDGPESFFQP